MKEFINKPTRKYLGYRRRGFGLTYDDRLELKRIAKCVEDLQYSLMRKDGNDNDNSNDDRGGDQMDEKMGESLELLLKRYRAIVDCSKLNAPLPRIYGRNRTIDSFNDLEIHTYFRFNSKLQLHQLMDAFRIPQKVTLKSRHVFLGEELLLVTLFRLHSPNSACDAAFVEVFGFEASRVSRCVNYFLDFMFENWAYLLLDNMEYWKPQLPKFATAINTKLAKENVTTDVNIFGFIDFTIIPTCKPSPKLKIAGKSALIESHSTHGIKFQTICLPNGMLFFVHGDVPCLHNDSDKDVGHKNNELDSKLANLQSGEDSQYYVYGDSTYTSTVASGGYIYTAYKENDDISEDRMRENHALKACRQSINWDFNTEGSLCKYITNKKNLRLGQSNVNGAVIVSFILMNAFTCMNDIQTTGNFECAPPSIFEWTAQGPKKLTI
eukprot:gene9436-19600_t